MSSPFKKQLLIQLSIAVVLVLLFVAGTAFLGSDTTRRTALIRNTKEQVQFEQAALASLVLLKEQEKRARDYQPVLERLLPHKDTLFSFKNNVTAIGRGERMVLGFKFGTENPPSASGPASVNFQISASGSAAGFRNIIEALERSDSLIRVTSFEVSFLGKPGTETFTGAINGKVFYRS